MQYSWGAASRIYEFFIHPAPGDSRALICRHLPSSAPSLLDDRTTSAGDDRLPSRCLRQETTRDLEQDRSSAEGEALAGAKEGRRRAERSLGPSADRARSYESYGRVSAADRIKNLGRKNPYDRPGRPAQTKVPRVSSSLRLCPGGEASPFLLALFC